MRRKHVSATRVHLVLTTLMLLTREQRDSGFLAQVGSLDLLFICGTAADTYLYIHIHVVMEGYVLPWDEILQILQTPSYTLSLTHSHQDSRHMSTRLSFEWRTPRTFPRL